MGASVQFHWAVLEDEVHVSICVNIARGERDVTGPALNANHDMENHLRWMSSAEVIVGLMKRMPRSAGLLTNEGILEITRFAISSQQ